MKTRKCSDCKKVMELPFFERRGWVCRECTANRRTAAAVNGICTECQVQSVTGSKYRMCEECRARDRSRVRKKKKTRSYRESGKRAYRKLKIEVMTRICKGTPACACCGEAMLEFLQIDHINNDGKEHRKASGCGSGEAMYRWLKKNNYPAGFQVLCCNCNYAKMKYGECPHGKTR